MPPLDIQSRLLYRDGLILIVDKPAGLPVHAGPGGGPTVEGYLDALRFGLPRPPALAHRLDRDTSGCLVLGRHPKALRKLGRLFSEGRVRKTYWAVVKGVPDQAGGTIDCALRKVATRKGGWRMVVDPEGQSAVTDWRLLGHGNGLSWLELHPHTGRMHQIRVHCTVLGSPILGDPIYGRAPDSPPPDVPLHLHARAISLPLYAQRDPVSAVADVPPHMIAALEACGWTEAP